jgi:hypothetical protein
MDSVRAFPQPHAGLPTQAAQVAHELGEVFDSVRYGRTTPLERDRHPRGQRDFDLNHHGSAYADENAVNRQEAGIIRTGEGVPLHRERRPDGSTTVILREPFTRGGHPIFVDITLVERADETVQVASVSLTGLRSQGLDCLGAAGGSPLQRKPADARSTPLPSQLACFHSRRLVSWTWSRRLVSWTWLFFGSVSLGSTALSRIRTKRASESPPYLGYRKSSSDSPCSPRDT